MEEPLTPQEEIWVELQVLEDTCSEHFVFMCKECFPVDIGTCQRCGAYWDACQQPVCPCGGEVL